MSEIATQAVGRADEPVLQNLLQLYTHDFSDHWVGTARGKLNTIGRFEDYPLKPYWTEANHAALLLRVEGELAGFALLNDVGHSGQPVDANIAEFFVVRKFRRGGIGTRFAHALFAMRAGSWEAAVARKNIAALGFWRSAIRRYPHASDRDEIDVASSDWDGPVLRFRVG